MTCPSCGSTNIYRSHARGVIERSTRAVLPVHYFRCHDCGWRGMRSAIKWGRFEKYAASILYVSLIGALVLALMGVLLFLLVFRPG
jgi:predicted RNA-binding Zn-ribbon protein involved in translation (DUF1610 family)